MVAEPQEWDPLGDEAERGTAEAAPEPAYLVVRVRDEGYALPVERVVEILRRAAPTPLPATPGFVEGVIDLRGRLVPVLDLGVRLGGRAGAGGAKPMVVVHAGGRAVGLLVDGLDGLQKYEAGAVRPLPADLPSTARDFVTGVVSGTDGRLIVVIDPDRLLPRQELEALAGGLAPA